MYIFAEPVTDAQADEIQATNKALTEQFEREVVGVGRPGSDEQGLQAEWQSIQHRVDEEVKDDSQTTQLATEADESEDMEESENNDKESDSIEEESEDNEEESHGIEESENSKEDSERIEEAEENEEESEDSEELDEETGTTVEDVKSQKHAKKTSAPTSNGPLAGWTLAIRNRINGKYVNRPEELAPHDNWSVEYHLNELPEDSVWSLYNKVKDERSKLIGEQRKSDELGLQFYRKIIHKYSAAGREWRDKQDEIENETGQTVYEPWGPGSPKYKNGGK